MTGSLCPPNDRLHGLAIGHAAPAETDALLEHLSDCEACRGRLQVMESQISLLSDFAESPPADHAFETEPELQAVVTRLVAGDSIFAPAAELQPGSQLGQYRLLEKIGAGGMGIVYRALHEKLSRHQAVKVLNQRLEGSPSARERFCEEIRLSAVCDHPRIVRVTDAGHADGRDYLVMELLDGVDLARLIRRLGPLSLADACELIRQAAEGLEAAHRAGIIHRDLKPSNLMLTGSIGVKILDLGVSHADQPAGQEGLTRCGQIMGTWEFMAPEQRRGARHADARSDVYALGATLQFLLTGKPPGPFTLEELPDEQRTLLRRFLADDPAERLQTARQAIEALEPLADGHRVPRLLEQFRTGQAVDLADTDVSDNTLTWATPQGHGATRFWAGGMVTAGCLALLGWLAWSPVQNPSPDDTSPTSENAAAATNAPSRTPEVSERDFAEWLLARGGAVALYRGNGPDGWFRKVASLPTVPSLVQKVEWAPFAGELTEEDLDRLCQLRALEGLLSNNTPISAAGVKRLVQNRKLKWLFIPRSGVTDQELANIGRLPKLENLDLAATSITDAGLRSLSGLKTLTWLRLAKTSIGDAGLESLRNLPNLAYLDLTGTQITDAGLAEAAVLPRLHTLIVDETSLTDAALDQLRTWPALRRVSLHKTSTTAQGRRQLQSQSAGMTVTP
jgi:serine/threonine protein kinase